MKKIIAFICLAAFLSAFTAGVAADETVAQAFPNETAYIIHTANMYASFSEEDNKNPAFSIGMSCVAAIKENYDRAVLIDSGNSMYGGLLSLGSDGSDVIKIMNEAGYDAVTVGLSDLSYGAEALSSAANSAEFSMLASGLSEGGRPIFDNISIFEVGGIKIGFFGVIAPTKTDDAEKLADDGIGFYDLIESASESVTALRAMGAEVIVAAGTLGSTPESLLFGQVDGIDVFIKNNAASGDYTVCDTHVVAAPQDSSEVGLIGIGISGQGSVSVRSELANYEDISMIELSDAAARKRDELSALTEKLSDSALERAMNCPIPVRSLPSAASGRDQETLGFFTADAIRHSCGTDIAVYPEIITEKLPDSAERLSEGDFIECYNSPFTLLTVVNMTPKTLREVLEESVAGIEKGEKGEPDMVASDMTKYLAPSGFSFVYDPAADVGERISSITLSDGRALDLKDNTEELEVAFPAGAELWNSVLDTAPVEKNSRITLLDAVLDYTEVYEPEKPAERIRLMAEENADRSIGNVFIAVCLCVIALAVIALIVYFYGKKKPKN